MQFFDHSATITEDFDIATFGQTIFKIFWQRDNRRRDLIKRKTLVDRRRDPNYEQVTGHIPKSLAKQFKVFCTENGITIAEALETAVQLFLQEKKNDK